MLLLCRDVTAQATASDFIITASADGHLKFWKKQGLGIEFVKLYRAHTGPVDGEFAGVGLGTPRFGVSSQKTSCMT